MENNREKKRVRIQIAGMQLTIVTDEKKEFVEKVADTVSDRIVEITRNSYNVNRVDASMLCAVDFCSDKLKAEKKVKNLEAQVALYELSVRKLKQEIEMLKNDKGILPEESAEAPVTETFAIEASEAEAENYSTEDEKQ